jgi:hypothetical protein
MIEVIMTLMIGAAYLVLSGPASEFERRQIDEYRASKSKKETQP